MNYNTATSAELIQHINDKFEDAKGRYGRLDIRWGIWSAEMNRSTRRRAQVGAPNDDVEGLAKAFAYWFLKSRLLDLEMESGFLTKIRKNLILDEIKALLY